MSGTLSTSQVRALGAELQGRAPSPELASQIDSALATLATESKADGSAYAAAIRAGDLASARGAFGEQLAILKVIDDLKALAAKVAGSPTPVQRQPAGLTPPDDVSISRRYRVADARGPAPRAPATEPPSATAAQSTPAPTHAAPSAEATVAPAAPPVSLTPPQLRELAKAVERGNRSADAESVFDRVEAFLGNDGTLRLRGFVHGDNRRLQQKVSEEVNRAAQRHGFPQLVVDTSGVQASSDTMFIQQAIVNVMKRDTEFAFYLHREDLEVARLGEPMSHRRDNPQLPRELTFKIDPPQGREGWTVTIYGRPRSPDLFRMQLQMAMPFRAQVVYANP